MVTRNNLKQFWGAEMEDLSTRGLALLRSREFVTVRVAERKKNANIMLRTKHIRGCALGIVPYTQGSGTYLAQGSKLMHWNCIATGDCAHDLEHFAEYQMQQSSGQEEWWPVLVLDLDEECILLVGTGYIVVICIYQLLGCTFYVWRILPSDWLC